MMFYNKSYLPVSPPKNYISLLGAAMTSTRTDEHCIYCHKLIPDRDEEQELYCSRQCGATHTLLKLTGGKVTPDDWEYLTINAGFPTTSVNHVDASKGEIVDPEPAPETKTFPETTKPVAKTKSSILYERLMELRNLEDDFTVDDLIEALEEDEGSLYESEESSRQQSLVDKEPRVTQAEERSSSNSIGSSALVSERKPTVIDHERSESNNTIDHAEEDMSQLGMASRFRKIINKFGSLPRRNGEDRSHPKQLAATATAEETASQPGPPSLPRIVIPGPSGDQWNDFVYIHRLLEKTGLGGSVDKPSW